MYLLQFKNQYTLTSKWLKLWNIMSFNLPNITHWLSKKSDWPMKLELPNPNLNALENRKKYFNNSGIDIRDVVSAEIVHGTWIAVVTKENKGQVIMWVDGLISNEPELILSVTIADCVPIYFFDSKKDVIWIIHAGWKWIIKNITKSLVNKMITNFNSNPKDISVYVWAHIQKCHFEIKEDIIGEFDNEFIIKENWIIKVDLLSMIKKQLLGLWLNKENVYSSIECTYCESDKYFSYRRDKPEKVEAMIAYIGIRK